MYFLHGFPFCSTEEPLCNPAWDCRNPISVLFAKDVLHLNKYLKFVLKHEAIRNLSAR